MSSSELGLAWGNLVVEALGHLAWPLIVVAGLILFRGIIAEKLGELSSVEGRGFVAKFRRELRKAEATVSSNPQWATGDIDIAVDLRTVGPRAAVVAAWLEVEQEMRRAAQRLNIPSDPRRPTALARDLAPTMSGDLRFLIRQLQELRNEAVHAPGFSMTDEAAHRYVSLARAAAAGLRSLGPSPDDTS